MRYRLFACTISLAFWLAAIAGPTPVRSETLNGAPASPHSSGHAHTNLINWEHTFLVARIFLDRLPATMPGSESDTPERIALGKRLFFERGISHNKTKSCDDCHLLTGGRAGADVTPTSQGRYGHLREAEYPHGH